MLPKFIFSLRIHVYNHVFSSPDVTNETLSGAWHPEHLALHSICIDIKDIQVFILHELSEAIFDLTDSEYDVRLGLPRPDTVAPLQDGAGSQPNFFQV